MRKHPSSIATKALLGGAALLACSWAWAAQVAGTVTQLSGAMMAKKADGKIKALALKSEVEEGDTLVTEKNSYALIHFIDNSEITLKPSTTFRVDGFTYEDGKPAADNAAFSLIKGGLRSITGALGKRSKEKFALKTPSATIGIRGTIFIVEWVEPTEQQLSAMAAWREASVAGVDGAGLADAKPLMLAQGVAPPAGRAPGLYVQVLDGMINVSNRGGSALFSAGQFGYVPNFNQPPIVLPINPGMQFAPPPTFAASGPNTTVSSQTGASVDCEVR